MLGTILNVVAIVAGSTIGAFARKGLGIRYREMLFTAMGLAATLLGISATVQHLSQSQYPVLFIFCLTVGGLIGTALRLYERSERLMQRKEGGKQNDLIQGLTTAVLLFCIGTLSMVGPVMSALYGDNTYLFTNATLDLVTSAVLASAYGFGIAWAAIILLVWQGGIYALALVAHQYISEALINEVSIVGGILIVASGLSILQVKDCKTLNLLPALAMPAVFFLLKHGYHIFF